MRRGNLHRRQLRDVKRCDVVALLGGNLHFGAHMAIKKQAKKATKGTLVTDAVSQQTSLVVFKDSEPEPASGHTSNCTTYSLSVPAPDGDAILCECQVLIDHTLDNGREVSSDSYRINPMKLIEWIRENGEEV